VGHETQNTDFVAVVFAVDAQGTLNQKPSARTVVHAAQSLLSCALWCGMGRLWRGMGGRRPPLRQQGLLGFHQPRDTQHVFLLSSGDSKENNSKPGLRVFTKHESRITAFMPFFPRFPTISRHFPLFFGPPSPRNRCPRAVRRRGRAAGRRRAQDSQCPPYGSPASIMTGANENGGCPAHRTLIRT
jgi:hypothetical protein